MTEEDLLSEVHRLREENAILRQRAENLEISAEKVIGAVISTFGTQNKSLAATFAGDEGATHRVERALVGTIITTPSTLDECATLERRHFLAPFRFDIIECARSFPKRQYDAGLLAITLEQRHGWMIPSGSTSWAVAVGGLMDFALWDPDLVPAYVKAVRRAATVRTLRTVGADAKRQTKSEDF